MALTPQDTVLSPPLIEFLDRAAGYFGDRYRRAILYGSYARGEPKGDSDIDILLVLSPISDYEADWDFCIEVASEIASRTGELISVLVCSAEDYENREHPLLMNIRNEGILLG